MWQALHAPASERVTDLWKTYLTDRRQDDKDVSRQENAWKALGPFFGKLIGSAITKDDCRDYSKSRQRNGLALGTIRTELEYLRACLNLKYGKGNTHVWVPAQSKPRDRYLTIEELNKLLSHVTAHHVKLFIVLAVTTAARMGAILDLAWKKVDFKHRTIDFNPHEREQTNKNRPIMPMNTRLRVDLEEASKGAVSDYVIEWNGKQVQHIKKAIREAAKRSGVPRSPHVFRHTAGVWMAQAEIPMQKIAQYMGHSTTKVTERTYARYSPNFMKDAADALEF